MIIDGKQIAEEIVASLGDTLRGKTLGVVMDEHNAATQSFVKIKERVAGRLGVTIVRFGPKEFDEALACDGVLVQLPIESGDELMAKLPPQKDADALGPAPLVEPPVAAAVGYLLRDSSVQGKTAAVVGKGKLVGTPVAAMLARLGAEVRVVSSEVGSLADVKNADIVVTGAGSPGLLKPEMLKQGAIVIDAGTSESAGKVAGDCDPACAEVASIFTPVPGGVGPIAVAMLFKNLSLLTKK